MKSIHRLPAALAALLLVSGLALVGCGKSAEKEAPAEAAAPAAPAEDAAPAETASAQEESTTESVNVTQVDVQATLSASDKAAQAKNWQAATDNLLKVQLSGSIKTEAESWQYNRRMTDLQNQLLQAADSGDPKAKAAIDLLRRTRRVQ